MKKKHCIMFIGFFVVTVVIIAAIWFFYCVSLAFHDNYKDKYTITETDDSIIPSFLKASMFGDEFNITDTQVNTYINEKICNGKDDTENNLEKAALYFHENEPSEFYAKIKLYGYEFGFYSKVSFLFNAEKNILSVTLSDAKLGDLNISDKILSYALSKALGNNKYVTVDNTTVKAKTSYNYKISDYSINLTMKQFTVHNGYSTCCTNSLSLEALQALKGYLNTDKGRQELKDFILDGINNIKDGIQSWWEERQKNNS